MRRGHRLAVVAGTAGLLLLLGAGPALADVVVEPGEVEPGSRDVTLVFRVTPDDPAVAVTGLEVFLPTARPLTGVSAPAPAGWTSRLVLEPAPASGDRTAGDRTAGDGTAGDGVAGDDVVSAIEWVADPSVGAVAVAFPVQVGQMPDGPGPVRFRAVQTDAAGRTVEWSDTWVLDAPRPAHDSLQVRLGAAPPPVVAGAHGDHHGDSGALGVPEVQPVGPALTIGGLVVLLAAVGATAAALGDRQRRRFEALQNGDGEQAGRTREP